MPEKPAPASNLSSLPVPVTTYDAAGTHLREDVLAVEEPLEIRLVHGPHAQRQRRTVAITMRTPGHDRELAVGFLLGEGLIRDHAEVTEAVGCGPHDAITGAQNVVRVELAPETAIELERLDRNFYTTSSCGVCGKSAIEALHVAAAPLAAEGLVVPRERLLAGPRALREAQAVFDRTGGLHAAGLFDAAGRLLVVREDVGRHNAVDKVIGSRLLAGALPGSETWLLVSGRASFELVQKALVAGIPMLAAVGAPSSLAVELAKTHGMTLVGFLRDGRFNVYSGEHRLGL